MPLDSNQLPERPVRDATAEFRRRRRNGNLAVLGVLIAIVVILYAITVVKFKVH